MEQLDVFISYHYT